MTVLAKCLRGRYKLVKSLANRLNAFRQKINERSHEEKTELRRSQSPQ